MDLPECLHIGLQTLVTLIICARDKPIRAGIAKHSARLVRVAKAYPNDKFASVLAVSILGPAMESILDTSDAPPKEVIEDMDIPTTLRFALETIKQPWASRNLLNFAVLLVASPTRHCASEYSHNPELVQFLVGCLRSNNMRYRCKVINGLLRIYDPANATEQGYIHMGAVQAALRAGLPEHLARAAQEYGMSKCEMFTFTSVFQKAEEAFRAAVRDKDLYKLGCNLVDLVSACEFITPGPWFYCDEAGQLHVLDSQVTGLPFTKLYDAFPHCIQAMRAEGGLKNQDRADILQLKSHLLKDEVDQAVAHARKCVERSPAEPYFHYIISSLGSDPYLALQHAKKGIKCNDVSPFLRFAMMRYAVENAEAVGY
jgi:hypothetical protein